MPWGIRRGLRRFGAERAASRFEPTILAQLSNLRPCRFDTPIGQARDSEVSTATKPRRQHLQGQDNERADDRAHDKAHASIASLLCLVLTKRLLAAQIKRQTPALEFRIGVELGQDLGGDRRIAADVAVEAGPGAFLFKIDAKGSVRRPVLLEGHGALQVGWEAGPRAGRRWTPLWMVMRPIGRAT